MKHLLFYRNFLLILYFSVVGCVRGDKYENPNEILHYSCKNVDFFSNYQKISLSDLKNKKEGIITENLYVEGYVSSSDQSGNIYKTLYIQDLPENPLAGIAIGLDMNKSYLNFPQGSKIFVSLKGLYLGSYGKVLQLGFQQGENLVRIPQQKIQHHLFRSCGEIFKIIPKKVTLKDLEESNQYLGCLVELNQVEFPQKYACRNFALLEKSADRQIIDPTSNKTTNMLRTSSFASFSQEKLPMGNGRLEVIFSKYNSNRIFYLLGKEGIEMRNSRRDGLEIFCQNENKNVIKISELKNKLQNRNLFKITEDIVIQGFVTANDQSSNLYKMIYVEDESAGIAVNINSLDLYQDERFQIGNKIKISLKNLYVGDSNGAIQLGGIYQNKIGQIPEGEIYKHFFVLSDSKIKIQPTIKKIQNLTFDDVGKILKIKDLQFVSSDLGKTYAQGNPITTRKLEDCEGNQIFLATNPRADFGNSAIPLLAKNEKVKEGNGDITAILGYYRGNYQLWIQSLHHIDFKNKRCGR